jgi:hypothetical protein
MRKFRKKIYKEIKTEKLENIKGDLEFPANFIKYENECRPRTMDKPKLYI